VTTLRLKATYWAYRGLGGAIEHAPEGLASVVAAGIVEVMAARDREPRRMVEQNLRRVLTATEGGPPDERTVRKLGRQAFREYARYWVDGARLPAVSVADVCRRMTIQSGYEHLKQAMAEGHGVVLGLPHVGSWEWGGSFLNAEGYPMTTVAERLEPPELFDWFVEQRRAMGLTIVPPDRRTSGRLIEVLRSGGMVSLLCDRDVMGNGVEVEFFGERTTLPAGPATLSLRTGATLLAAVVYSGPGRHHTAFISPPIDTTRRGSLRRDVGRVTQQLAYQLEEFISRAPEQWHMFQPNWPSDQSQATPDQR
jgi:KDO2-lipid IV(A) lauroyltransferase